jgi:hypothetical protein
MLTKVENYKKNIDEFLCALTLSATAGPASLAGRAGALRSAYKFTIFHRPKYRPPGRANSKNGRAKPCASVMASGRIKISFFSDFVYYQKSLGE